MWNEVAGVPYRAVYDSKAVHATRLVVVEPNTVAELATRASVFCDRIFTVVALMDMHMDLRF